MLEGEVAALERRVLALQAALGASNLLVNEPESLDSRVRGLVDKVQQLEAGLDPLKAGPFRAAYNRNKKLLDEHVLEELKTPGAKSQLKKAIVLTSEPTLTAMHKHATELDALEAQIAAPLPLSKELQSKLDSVETQNMLVTRQILAQHAQVEAMTTQYAAIMHNLSKKFQLYDQYIRQLELARGVGGAGNCTPP